MSKITKFTFALFVFTIVGFAVASARAETNGMVGLTAYSGPQDCSKYSFVIGVFVDDIKKKQQEAAAYDGPDNKISYVSQTQDDYIRMAISKRYRDKFFVDKKMEAYRADKACNKIDPALDALATIVAKTIPLYVPERGSYAVRNPTEETLMKGTVTDLTPATKIFKIGLESANWGIDKNEFGIPTDRFKRGLIYIKPANADDPYCRMIFVNIVQDYSGGGTYGASYGNFIRSDVAGCPPGN